MAFACWKIDSACTGSMLAAARVGARAVRTNKTNATARAGNERNMAERAGRILIVITI
jgi:hypothetical protein